MIGLTEAKAVIKKALNYYKMQKLYAERGVKQDNPAMHMIFTGNPGTAKTTVARLFARIMRENGVTSRGQLVEVLGSGRQSLLNNKKVLPPMITTIESRNSRISTANQRFANKFQK